MSWETVFMLRSALLGFSFAFLYDCIRVFRRLFRHGNFWTAVEDFAYWVFCGMKVFFFLRRDGNGTIRWFAVLGAAIGIWAYLRWLSPWFLKISVGLLRPVTVFLGRLRRFLWKKLTDILKWTLTGLCKVLKMISKGVINYVRTLRRCKSPEEHRE